MKILLIGGSGFLSGHVTQAALRAGHDVTIVTRGQRPTPPGVRAIIADRQDRAGFSRAIESANMHWDLAVDGIGYTAADAVQDVESIFPRCDHFVFVSTDFVYSTTSRPFPVDETFGEFQSDYPYGHGKREAEVVLLSARTSARVTVLRPCHIYGPGSLLGCLPNHGRDARLIERLRGGERLVLVGGGHFLQQPVFAPDLAAMILSCHGNAGAAGRIFHAAGPDIIESRQYYEIIARHLGVSVTIDEVSVQEFLQAHPDRKSFCCHRVYDMSRAIEAGLTRPATPVVEGLRLHLQSLLT